MFLDVEGCLKAVFTCARGYGESPCFLGMGFSVVVSLDCGHYIVCDVDGVYGL